MAKVRQSPTLTKLFSLLLEAVELHSSHDELWSDQFKDGGKGAKWQELQLVGSLVGIAMALAASPDDIEDRIEANPFSAKLNAALWTAKTVAEGGTGDLFYTMNKEAAGDDLGLTLQTGFVTKALVVTCPPEVPSL